MPPRTKARTAMRSTRRRRRLAMMRSPSRPCASAHKQKAGVAAGLWSFVATSATSVRGLQCGLLLPGDRALHGGLHLSKGAAPDLPHPLPRYSEFAGEILQGHRIVRQPPRLEDATLARIEHPDGAVQRLAAMIELLVLGHDDFLVGRIVDQPVLPFAGLTVVADRRVERGIAA